MKILVCGGRDFGNIIKFNTEQCKKEYHFIHKKLLEIIDPLSIYYNPNENWLPTDITIINGDAPGVDTVASDWAIINYTQLEVYRADWNKYKRSAGYIRNNEMLTKGKPDLVIAFPGGRGTAHMVKIAKEAGVKVIEIDYNND